MQEMNTNSKNPKDIDYLLLIAGILITGILLLIGISKNCVNAYADDSGVVEIDGKKYIVSCNAQLSNGKQLKFDYFVSRPSELNRIIKDNFGTSDNLSIYTYALRAKLNNNQQFSVCGVVFIQDNKILEYGSHSADSISDESLIVSVKPSAYPKKKCHFISGMVFCILSEV